jgi:hypothetical protein
LLHSGSSPPPGAPQCPDFDLVIRNGTVGIWFDEGAGAFFPQAKTGPNHIKGWGGGTYPRGSKATCVTTLDVRADTARSRIIINGQDAQEANWFETWGEEFQQKMPAPIKTTIDEIMAKTERDPDGKARERILERLRRIRELLRPSRYRRDPNGVLRAIGEAPGGSTAKSTGHAGDSGTGGGKGGRSIDDYLADLVEVGGDPVTPVMANPKEPTVKWISKAEGTREGAGWPCRSGRNVCSSLPCPNASAVG